MLYLKIIYKIENSISELPTGSSDGVITNGLLLLSADDTLFEIFRKNYVFVAVTKYKPTETMIDKIISRLDEYGLTYEISDLISDFRLQYNMNGSKDASENHRKCLDWGCHTVRGKKIGGCYYSVMADIANEFWNINIPGEGCCWDYTSIRYSGAVLLKRLVSPTRLCGYCNSIPCTYFPWHQVADKPDIKEWFG